MNENIQSQSRKHVGEFQANGPVKELEFQVSTVLNRLEEAVEKFDSKGTISSLESGHSLPTAAKASEDVLNIIQDAIVNLDLSREDNELNLAILPALKDVDKLSLVSHSIKHYMLCLDVAHSEYLINWIENDTSLWLAQLFRFKGSKIFYDVNYLEGCLKLFRLLLSKRYPTYHRDGFEAFHQTIPVIYYNSPSTYVIAQYLCYYSGLPLRVVREIPQVSEKLDEAETIRNVVKESLDQNGVPLLFLAEAETQRQPLQCNINIVRSVCNEYKIWLHLIGNSVTVLPILRANREEENIALFDSVSVTLGPWLNIPALPTATLYRVEDEDEKSSSNIESRSKQPTALPLWTSIQCLGEERILNDFIQKYESCRRLYLKLKNYSCLRLLNQPQEENANFSITDLITKSVTENDVFELAITCVIFKFLPENNELWTTSYCDKLNSWLSQVLHRELSVVPISIVEFEEHGTTIMYSPFSNTPVITDAEWSTFFNCLDQQLDVLNATVAQKETLYKLLKESTCLKLVELPDWAGLGGVRYIPEGWIRDSPENLNKDEVNRLNQQIVQQLRHTDAAFSIGESVDGYCCIRFGMVGSDSDVTDLIGLVESVGKQEEESWNFIDTMAEVVKKGIQTALEDLQKESEEKLWQEGILRHVPVFGNIVNWWSPLNKENGGGIKGRSLDLTAGVIESTENIYRYHMQGAAPKSVDSKSQIEAAVEANNSLQSEVAEGNVQSTE